MAEVEKPCRWIQGMKVKIRECPEKFWDYVVENGQLYRNVGQRADYEDYFPWKLCVPRPRRVRVLQEWHDAPTKTGGRGSDLGALVDEIGVP